MHMYLYYERNKNIKKKNKEEKNEIHLTSSQPEMAPFCLHLHRRPKFSNVAFAYFWSNIFLAAGI